MASKTYQAWWKSYVRPHVKPGSKLELTIMPWVEDAWKAGVASTKQSCNTQLKFGACANVDHCISIDNGACAGPNCRDYNPVHIPYYIGD